MYGQCDESRIFNINHLTVICEGSLNSNGQQLHQYQQNKQLPLTFIH